MYADVDGLFQIDQACEQFESEWSQKQSPPNLEDFVNLVPADLRKSAFESLLPIDVEFRRSHALACSADQYQQAYPEYKDVILATLVPEDTLSMERHNSLTGEVWRQQFVDSALRPLPC